MSRASPANAPAAPLPEPACVSNSDRHPPLQFFAKIVQAATWRQHPPVHSAGSRRLVPPLPCWCLLPSFLPGVVVGFYRGQCDARDLSHSKHGHPRFDNALCTHLCTKRKLPRSPRWPWRTDVLAPRTNVRVGPLTDVRADAEAPQRTDVRRHWRTWRTRHEHGVYTLVFPLLPPPGFLRAVPSFTGGCGGCVYLM